MSFALTSSMPLLAAMPQYSIKDQPVSLTIHGPKSYCHVGGIEDKELKALLSKVGVAYEQQSGAAFYNVVHRFIPAQEGVGFEENNQQVRAIFDHVSRAISCQTDSKFGLGLIDVNELCVKKGIQRPELFQSGREAYELDIRVSAERVEAAVRSGLIFREYGLPKAARKPDPSIINLYQNPDTRSLTSAHLLIPSKDDYYLEAEHLPIAVGVGEI